jgi:multiple sugar transport system permease protein/raffinose/stachyose/melibiose transport system permease protein
MNAVLGDKRAIALLLSPAMICYSLIMLAPMLWSLGYTLFTGNAIRGFTFSGWSNFAELWGDSKAHSALAFTIKYGLVVTAGQVVIGYLLALLYVFYLRRASSIVRTLVFFPVILPTVAVALLFEKLFQIVPQPGLVNSAAMAFGGDAINWFASGDRAFLVIAAMDIWRAMGFYAVLLYAGLVDIPTEVLESARLDGAGAWRLIRSIVLPLSLPVVISAAIFSINGTLKVFDSIYALTGGGPGNQTTPLTLYMYQTAFAYGDYGYGCTIALALAVLCLLVTLMVFRTSRKDVTA